ncbi:hypothetical protein B484DRAFT_14727, partial [Ochromonadaceae sp. CCMP2298]
MSMDMASVQKAMAELAAVKEQIAKLQETREQALASVAKIKADVDKIDVKDTKDQPDYGSQQYWDERYKSDPTQSGEEGVGGQTKTMGGGGGGGAATTPTSASTSTSATAETLYEWYLSWDQMQPLLSIDLARLRAMPEQHGLKSPKNSPKKQQPGQQEQEQQEREPRVLVLGCGNSSLCEDLWHFGLTSVHGMDYSPTAISMMQRRAQDVDMGIQYFSGDARRMPEVHSGHYDLLLDKGTLDAIASGDAEKEGAGGQATDAEQYIVECWRTLRVKGLFVVVTTMPPHIFEPLAVQPLTLRALGQGEQSGTGAGTGAGAGVGAGASTDVGAG